MRELMREIVNRLYTFHINADDPAFRDKIEQWRPLSERWGDPTEDTGFLRHEARLNESCH